MGLVWCLSVGPRTLCYHHDQTSVRVLIDYRPALRTRTGVGEWVHQLVTALAGIETPGVPFELTVFTSSWKDRLTQALPENVGTIDRRIPVSVLNYCWHRLGWPPVETVAGARFDVVHSPHPLLIPSRRAAQIVTIHDLDFLDHPERTEAEVRRDYADLVTRHAKQADRVVVPSRYTGDQVAQRLGVSPEAITLCPNGPPTWPARTRWPESGHILFVGAVAPRKNVGALLDAYEALLARRPDSVPLVLAGPLSAQAGPWMKRIESPPLAGHVRCTGYLDKESLRQCYEDARVLVLPSLHEGFGLPALEAMSIGVPVVVSNRGALPEVVGDAGLVVDPTQTSALSDAIERITSDDDLARALVEKGRHRAAAFSWRASAVRLLEAYQDVTSRASAIDGSQRAS